MQYWTDLYLEIASKISGIWQIQEPVDMCEDLNTRYSNPKDFWACKVNDNGYYYVFYNEKWNNTKIKEPSLKQIAWVDLWHEQISYLTEELPFPTPAIFIAFRLKATEDKSMKSQICDTQIDFYLFYETFSDTYASSINQNSATEFLKQLTEIHKLFHATSGVNYFEMKRIDMNREESGGAGNLYRISFDCLVDDSSAMPVITMDEVNDINIDREDINSTTETVQEYHV